MPLQIKTVSGDVDDRARSRWGIRAGLEEACSSLGELSGARAADGLDDLVVAALGSRSASRLGLPVSPSGCCHEVVEAATRRRPPPAAAATMRVMPRRGFQESNCQAG